MLALEPGDPRSIETDGRRYRVLARIGAGGMGVVYFGRSTAGRAVAIKLVHTELAENREFRERLRREVAAAQAVGGAFTAPVIDADPEAEIPWLATEFLPSVSVRDAVHESGALPVDSVWLLAAGVAEALRSIHQAGVVHRDVTPSNVLLTADGPRLIDFGIAGIAEVTSITRLDGRAGSPGFMSPEQAAGDSIGFASDVFSFGATLAYACTGAEPFGEGSWYEKMYRVQRESPRLDAIADDELRTLVAACMDRDPSRRPTSRQLAERLSAVTPGAWASLLPRGLMAEIERRAAEAENPPIAAAPRPSGPVRGQRDGRASRRRLLLGAAGAVLAAGVAVPGAAWYRARHEPAAMRTTAPTPRPTPVRTPTPTPAPSASGSAPASPVVRTPNGERRKLTFSLTGNVRITSLTYTVNGKSTTLTNVKLPWEKVVPLPYLPPRSSWELVYRCPEGQVSYLVQADEYNIASGGYTRTGELNTGAREVGTW